MGAGAEGQPRIQFQIYRLGIRRGTPAGDDPQPFTKAHGRKIIHPGPFPDLIIQRFVMMGLGLQPLLLQGGEDQCRVTVRIEQGADHGVLPQGASTGRWLEDWLIGAVGERNRAGAHVFQCGLKGIRMGFGGGKVELEPGHVVASL